MTTLTGEPGSFSHQKEIAEVPTTIIEPSTRWFSLQLDRVWKYRELLYFLVWRDIKVRYKQAALGVTWIVLQPIASMVVFSLLFGSLLDVPSGDVPYPIFAYAALLPWNYFSFSLTRASTSLVNNAHLLTKVYFPRLLIPISGVFAGLVDFLVAFVVFFILMAIYGIAPTVRIALLPALLLLALATALGFSLWLSALNVRYRDVQQLVPFLVQMWMYATPVVYGSTLIPERFRWLLALNPMTGVVEGFRWALLGDRLGDAAPSSPLFAVSVVIALVALFSGAVFFRRTERGFADIV